MNLTDILSVLGGAVLGAAVAYINMRISKANMNASNMAAVMGVNMLRLLLAVCFFVCRAYDLPMMATLIAVAVGLSGGGMLFLKIMVNKTQPQSKDTADGGEN